MWRLLLVTDSRRRIVVKCKFQFTVKISDKMYPALNVTFSNVSAAEG